MTEEEALTEAKTTLGDAAYAVAPSAGVCEVGIMLPDGARRLGSGENWYDALAAAVGGPPTDPVPSPVMDDPSSGFAMVPPPPAPPPSCGHCGVRVGIVDVFFAACSHRVQLCALDRESCSICVRGGT